MVPFSGLSDCAVVVAMPAAATSRINVDRRHHERKECGQNEEGMDVDDDDDEIEIGGGEYDETVESNRSMIEIEIEERKLRQLC